jgi:general secretion pathway protein A
MLKHFGMNEKPFNITADPRFFYFTATHKEAMFKVEWVIRDNQGISAIWGEAGSGKTSLAKILLEKLADTHRIVYITNPDFHSEMMMAKTVSYHLGIPPKRSLEAQRRAIETEILRQYENNTPFVFLFDESQLMRAKSLELIRQWSNIEVLNEKACSFVLFGQPELRAKIYKKRALKRRVFAPHTLNSLTVDDMCNLILFRVNVAGGQPDLFTLDALEEVYKRSEGSVWVAMKICAFALQVAFNEKAHTITPEMIDIASKLES